MRNNTLILVSLTSEALSNEPKAVGLISAALLKLQGVQINQATYLLVGDVDHVETLLCAEAFGQGGSNTKDVYRVFPLSAFLVHGGGLHNQINELCREHLKEELIRLASTLPR